MQEGPGFSQLLEELELELLQALAEENPHILLVQQHALPSLRVIHPWAANEFVSEGVKSGDVWEGGKVGQGLADTRFHLTGRLLRKGQGQNVLRFKSGDVFEQMDNPLGNDTGLAASRARNNEQRSIAVFNRPQLFRVELQHEYKSGFRIQGKPPAHSFASRIWFSWRNQGTTTGALARILNPESESYPFPRNQATTMISLP
jgi:hypothetical protein